MNPAELIGNNYYLCRLIKTKRGVIYNPIFTIKFLPNRKTDSEVFNWVPTLDGLAIVNDNWRKVYLINALYDGDPMGFGVDTLDTIVLLPAETIRQHKAWDVIFEEDRGSTGINCAISDCEKVLLFQERHENGMWHIAPFLNKRYIEPSPQMTVVIPHLETLEPLRVAIECWRQQTLKPHIMIIDTGSRASVCDALESLRASDLEIHYIRSHSYNNSSSPVTAALDLAQSMVRSDKVFHTHADVFPMRDDLLESWATIVNDKCPVIGYKMSPRDWEMDDGTFTKEWEWMVGHSALMVYMPTIHLAGITWSFQRIHQMGYKYKIGHGWPDTEIAFNWGLRQAGIKPVFMGFDKNYVRQTDAHIDHVRSYPGMKLYNHEKMDEKENEMQAAIRDAKERLSLTIAKRLSNTIRPRPSHSLDNCNQCSAEAPRDSLRPLRADDHLVEMKVSAHASEPSR